MMKDRGVALPQFKSDAIDPVCTNDAVKAADTKVETESAAVKKLEAEVPGL